MTTTERERKQHQRRVALISYGKHSPQSAVSAASSSSDEQKIALPLNSTQEVSSGEQTRAISPTKPLASEEYVRKTMPSFLGTFEMTATYVCALFLITNAVIAATGGALSLLYLLLGAITFFIPCVIAVAQLGAMFPHEGALYNWTYKALGSYWSLFIGLCYWLSGVLAIVLGANAFVTIIQGLNNAWLTAPWQQGVVMLLLIAFAGFMGTQRFRTVQNIVILVFGLTIIATALVGVSAVVWLVTGHASMTSFGHASDWAINPGSFALFGIITLNFIGASGPLNMGGEIAGRRERVVTQHLFWGTLIVFLCYFVATLSVLVVRGPAILNATVLPFEIVTTVDVVLGKVAGDVVVICILCYCVIATLFYTYSSARLLMVASIDQRIPARTGKLNKYRVPANASIFQAVATGVVTFFIFIVAPYAIRLGRPADLATMFYTINSAALTIVWTIATAFFFIDLVCIYIRDPKGFMRKRLFAMPIIWASVLVGFAACVATIVGTLLNSWIPQMIGNGSWWYIVGGLTVLCLIAAAIVSLIANSEADWEELKK